MDNQSMEIKISEVDLLRVEPGDAIVITCPKQYFPYADKALRAALDCAGHKDIPIITKSPDISLQVVRPDKVK